MMGRYNVRRPYSTDQVATLARRPTDAAVRAAATWHRRSTTAAPVLAITRLKIEQSRLQAVMSSAVVCGDWLC